MPPSFSHINFVINNWLNNIASGKCWHFSNIKLIPVRIYILSIYHFALNLLYQLNIALSNNVKTSAIISGKFLFIKISMTSGNLFEMKRPLAPHWHKTQPKKTYLGILLIYQSVLSFSRSIELQIYRYCHVQRLRGKPYCSWLIFW